MINENLYKAVETGKAEEVAKALTEEKINAATYFGAKSILLATEQGNREILEMLLKNGEKIPRESFWRRTAFLAIRTAKNAGNTEILELLLEYGAGEDKKRLDRALAPDNETQISPSNAKIIYEDGIFIPEKCSKDNTFIQCAKEGKIKKIKSLLEEGGVSGKAFVAAIDAALEKGKQKTASFLLEYGNDSKSEIYVDYLKAMFLKSAYAGDSEKVKLYLEKLIENAVGVLTDESGKSTLEIALENPADIIKILSNYGFHENALHYAYRCLSNF